MFYYYNTSMIYAYMLWFLLYVYIIVESLYIHMWYTRILDLIEQMKQQNMIISPILKGLSLKPNMQNAAPHQKKKHYKTGQQSTLKPALETLIKHP